MRAWRVNQYGRPSEALRLDDTEAAAFFFPFHLAWLGLHDGGPPHHRAHRGGVLEGA
ncbi:MAG: hypothetical protein OXT07_01570 [bacterium]|nr:hypothetical protein [bacterium]MDE0217210.1 hypothetical protein [bacterium]